MCPASSREMQVFHVRIVMHNHHSKACFVEGGLSSELFQWVFSLDDVFIVASDTLHNGHQPVDIVVGSLHWGDASLPPRILSLIGMGMSSYIQIHVVIVHSGEQLSKCSIVLGAVLSATAADEWVVASSNRERFVQFYIITEFLFELFHVEGCLGLTGLPIDLSVRIECCECHPLEIVGLKFPVTRHIVDFEALGIKVPVVCGVVFVVASGQDDGPHHRYLLKHTQELHVVFALIGVQVVTDVPLNHHSVDVSSVGLREFHQRIDNRDVGLSEDR